MEVSSILYSFPYWIVLTLYVLLALIELRNKGNKYRLQLIRYVSIVVFLFFFGLRAWVGYDCHGYASLYESTEPLFHSHYLENWNNLWVEPGYVLYSSVLKWISGDYAVFVFISCLLDAAVINWFLKRYSPNYALAFFVLLAMHTTMEIELMRNVKAIMLFLLAIPYIEQRRFWRYTGLMALAFTFHTSSVILYPLYFFVHKPCPKKVFLIGFILCNVLYFSQIEYLKPIIRGLAGLFGGKIAPMTEIYLESDLYGANRGVSIGYIERFVTSILVMIYYDKLLAQRKSNVIFVNMFIIFIFIMLLFNQISIIAERVGLLFAISYWIVWPSLLYCFRWMSNRIVCHGRGLPVRGQRTRTNARTRKGKKKTVAVKKSVKAMR